MSMRILFHEAQAAAVRGKWDVVIEKFQAISDLCEVGIEAAKSFLDDGGIVERGGVGDRVIAKVIGPDGNVKQFIDTGM